uniref:Uncharacterized protein n=1 Tax=Arundo donax TaxID=35708 RepID=A0A0A8ZTZ9_ARUDO
MLNIVCLVVSRPSFSERASETFESLNNSRYL